MAIRHNTATARLRQRGLREIEIKLALELGTHTADGVFVRGSDADRAIACLKREIEIIQRLRGIYVAMPNETVVTVFRPDQARSRAILRDRPYTHTKNRGNQTDAAFSAISL